MSSENQNNPSPKKRTMTATSGPATPDEAQPPESIPAVQQNGYLPAAHQKADHTKIWAALAAFGIFAFATVAIVALREEGTVSAGTGDTFIHVGSAGAKRSH
jgi:hypothetical protein